MKRFKSVFSIYALVGAVFFGLVLTADAQTSDSREARNIARQLNSKVDDFRYGLINEMKYTPLGRIEESQIKIDIQNLKNNIIKFERNVLQNRETAEDVSDIVYATERIDSFMQRFRFGSRVNNDWASIRKMIDNLSARYRVQPNSRNDDYNSPYPNNNPYPQNYPSSTRSSYGLTGTYRLDVSRSEDTDEIAERIVRNNNIRDNRTREDLENKLEAPDQIAIDVRGNQVTLASSKGAPVTFSADGTTRTENVGGRTVRVRAVMRGNDLVVSSLGGETDYTVTFTSIDNGRSLKVTRRITTDYLRQTVFAESIYDKTDSVAGLGIDSRDYPDNNGTYSSSDPRDYPNSSPYPRTSPGRTGRFIVPNGMILTGVLENEINSKVSQTGDRFRMTVQSPNEFRGSVIEGYISGIDRSGRVSGRSQVTFNFERITLRNGQAYDFAGNLQSVTDTNGETIRTDQESTAKGDSQTKETIKRGGIGAGIGAIIGAIAGGGKGAAIGAVIGGTAGAGSVIVQGKGDLELKQGSMITVQSSSPIR